MSAQKIIGASKSNIIQNTDFPALPVRIIKNFCALLSHRGPSEQTYRTQLKLYELMIKYLDETKNPTPLVDAISTPENTKQVLYWIDMNYAPSFNTLDSDRKQKVLQSTVGQIFEKMFSRYLTLFFACWVHLNLRIPPKRKAADMYTSLKRHPVFTSDAQLIYQIFESESRQYFSSIFRRFFISTGYIPFGNHFYDFFWYDSPPSELGIPFAPNPTAAPLVSWACEELLDLCLSPKVEWVALIHEVMADTTPAELYQFRNATTSQMRPIPDIEAGIVDLMKEQQIQRVQKVPSTQHESPNQPRAAQTTASSNGTNNIATNATTRPRPSWLPPDRPATQPPKSPAPFDPVAVSAPPTQPPIQTNILDKPEPKPKSVLFTAKKRREQTPPPPASAPDADEIEAAELIFAVAYNKFEMSDRFQLNGKLMKLPKPKKLPKNMPPPREPTRRSKRKITEIEDVEDSNGDAMPEVLVSDEEPVSDEDDGLGAGLPADEVPEDTDKIAWAEGVPYWVEKKNEYLDQLSTLRFGDVYPLMESLRLLEAPFLVEQLVAAQDLIENDTESKQGRSSLSAYIDQYSKSAVDKRERELFSNPAKFGVSKKWARRRELHEAKEAELRAAKRSKLYNHRFNRKR